MALWDTVPDESGPQLDEVRDRLANRRGTLPQRTWLEASINSTGFAEQVPGTRGLAALLHGLIDGDVPACGHCSAAAPAHL
jgi:hypothetical protein